MDQLILHYEGILEKNRPIRDLRYRLLEIRKLSKNHEIKRLTHWPPYER